MKYYSEFMISKFIKKKKESDRRSVERNPKNGIYMHIYLP